MCCIKFRRRCWRKYKSWFTVKFWVSLLNNRCHSQLGILARRSTIITFVIVEILVAVGAGLFYLWEPEVVNLGWSYKGLTGYLVISGVRALQGCLGAVAAHQRKIKTMRLYCFLLPPSIVYSLVLAVPVLRMGCDCTDFRQCEILTGFLRGKVANMFPNPQYVPFGELPGKMEEGDVALKPPESSSETKSEDQSSQSSQSRLLAEQFSQLPQRAPVRSLGEGKTEIVQKEVTYYSEDDSWGWSMGPEGVGSAFDESETVTVGPNDKKKVKDMLDEVCACEGPIVSQEGRGPGSCLFWDERWKTQQREFLTQDVKTWTWCHIRKSSEEACRTYSNEVQMWTDPERVMVRKEAEMNKEDGYEQIATMWTEDICRVSGCQCKGIAMAPPLDLKRWDENTYGIKCGLWHEDDVRPWCFVGYDSICSDRKPYHVHPSVYHRSVTQIEKLSQFKSSIPCNDEYRLKAISWCKMGRYSMLFAISCLTISGCFMVPVVCMFVQNRCGDSLFMVKQFDVEFSSDEEDDFDLNEGVPGVQSFADARRSGKSSRATSRENSLSSFNLSSASASINDGRPGMPNRREREIPESFASASSDGSDEGIELADVSRGKR